MKIDIAKALKNKAGIGDSEMMMLFSVVIPVIEKGDEQSILFEVRSEKLIQPNEICFPGGRIEHGESPAAAALRETREELLVAPNQLELLGESDTIITPFNSIIYPFAAKLKEYHDTFSTDEVKEVFRVPLPYFMETQPLKHFIELETRPQPGFPYELIQQGENYAWRKGRYPVLFYHYEDRIIWGITARIIFNFVQRLK